MLHETMVVSAGLILAFMMGVTMGIPVGILLDILFEKWARQLTRKIFGKWMEEGDETKA